MGKVPSAEGYKLFSRFESVRKTLLDDRYADRLNKPIAYWALPKDRRLPLALLGRTVGELVSTPFDELRATPGVGQKKIDALVKLLDRATNDEPPATTRPAAPPPSSAELTDNGQEAAPREFDPSVVSEVVWAEWRKTVRDHGIGEERLGRLAPSLRKLPSVIWHRRIGYYIDYSLQEIWRLKTHGTKRVHAILEVFFHVHELLRDVSPSPAFGLRIVPRRIRGVEYWIDALAETWLMPGRDEICRHVLRPLLEQIGVDMGSSIRELAEGRLGLQAGRQSVRSQSNRVGVTRARIYQLLDGCAKVMRVRWPDGECYLARLDAHLGGEGDQSETRKLVQAANELFFPDRHTHSNGDGTPRG